MKKRLEYIDAAKGIGILLIVLGHVSTTWGIISNWGSYFKISIFFVISGLLQYKSKKELCIIQKAKSLLIPYVVFSVISIGISIVARLIRQDDFSFIVIQIIKTITLRGIGTLWFLPSLLIAVLLHKAFMKSKIIKPLSLSVIPFVFIIAPFWRTFRIHENISLEFFLYCVVITILKGIVAYWFYEISYWILDKILNDDKRKRNFIAAIITLIICSLCTIVIKKSSIDFNRFSLGVHPSLFFLFGIIISFDIVICLENLRCHSKVLQYIGENSLFIMCTHYTLLIVPVVPKLIGKIMGIIKFPEKIEYLLLVSISLLCVFLIEAIMIEIWNKMKTYLTKNKAFVFLEYI